MSQDKSLTYTSYLALEEILGAQRPNSDEHDEILFIVVHQVYELWFKQLIHELGYLQRMLEDGNDARAFATFKRVLTILKLVVAQLDVIETMTPGPVPHLPRAARVLVRLPVRPVPRARGDPRPPRPGRPDRVPRGRASTTSRVKAAMERPSVYDSFLRYLADKGYDDPGGGARARRHAAGRRSPRACRRALLQAYRDDGEPAQVAERLVDFDEGFMEWRYHHVKMVERTIGTRPGTGGYRRRVPALDAAQAVLPRPLGRPQRALIDGRSREHYSAFRVSERLFLTGHSHQAWPDVAPRGAARGVAGRGRARRPEVGARVREGRAAARRGPAAARRPGRARRARAEHARARAALPLRARRCASGRSSSRPTASSTRCGASSAGWARKGSRSCGCPPARSDTLAERLAAEAPGASAVLVSAVLFEDARIVPGLADLAGAARRRAPSCSSTPTTRSAASRSRSPGSSGPGSSAAATSTSSSARATASCGCRRRPTSCGRRSRAGSPSSRSSHAAHEPGATQYPRGGMRFAGLDLRPDEPLPRRAGARLLRGAGPDPGAPARELPPPDDAARRALRRARRSTDVTRDRETPLERFGGFVALESERRRGAQPPAARRRRRHRQPRALPAPRARRRTTRTSSSRPRSKR